MIEILIPVQKIPFVGRYFHKEIHPADNVSYMCIVRLFKSSTNKSLALLNYLVYCGR